MQENFEELLYSTTKKWEGVIIELLMPEAPKSNMTSQHVSRLDNGVLLQLEGQMRANKEFKAFCKGSGFSNFQVVCCAYYLGGLGTSSTIIHFLGFVAVMHLLVLCLISVQCALHLL